jgi:hypothetical protein
MPEAVADPLSRSFVMLFPKAKTLNFKGLILISLRSRGRARRERLEPISRTRNSENSEEQRQSPLFFRSSETRRPRISAAHEPSLADNFREKQQKTAR